MQSKTGSLGSARLSHLYLIYVITIMASKYLLLYATCQACDLLYFDTLITITPLNKVTKKNLLIYGLCETVVHTHLITHY